MESIDGIYCCDCGNQFEWKTFFLQPGEAVFGRWEDLKKNVIRSNVINNKYHITIRCPECNKTHFIKKDKED